jgi:YidC/Oxa1 family membrane protein insertase
MEEGNPMASAQKMMVFLAPLFGLFGINFPLGVLMYWVTSNSWTLAQQHYIYKRYPAPNPNAPVGGATVADTKPDAPASGGLLSKLKKDSVPEAPPPQPEPKVVRRQPVKQSRSKRTGTGTSKQ